MLSVSVAGFSFLFASEGQGLCYCLPTECHLQVSALIWLVQPK